jgi:hypothetical protein
MLFGLDFEIKWKKKTPHNFYSVTNFAGGIILSL